MELWQLDVTANAFLADGREVKIVTGVDDHSRFCVLAKAVMRATARPVCLAFVDAMRVYGVPEEVLTDNGKVFTGRFHKPGVPVEVLFDKICRENGITHRLTKIHSPTTTGKIERLHQTLQRELLDVHGPFESIEALQAALDAWRGEYNTDRPHQSLGMAFPASRFTPASSALELRIPVHGSSATVGRYWAWWSACRGGGSGGPGFGELVDRRAAGLARPSADRAAGHPLGRPDQPACAAGRHPDQDPAIPAWGH
jgi:Integrase core domain